MSLGKRLSKVLKKLEMTQIALAKALNISNVVINRYVKDKTTPDYNFLNKLTSVYNININWLITGNGSIFMSDKLKEINNRQYYNMPILAPVSCGSPQSIEEAEPDEHIMIDTLSLAGNFNDYFAFYASGDSMYPHIASGDVVIVKQENDWGKADERICVVRVNTEVTLKKVITYSERNEILLQPLNKDFSPIIINPENTENVLLIGIAVMAVKNL
ncbi:MAG: LexA family transcriptional regulator [Candidatus Cloacimonetes bacterium]|nr:LexA family transcriptional regulator [Candidatus Cloacimonadota bacterium]